MLRLTLFLCATLLAGVCHAAQFQVLCDSPGEIGAQGCTIKLSGEIKAGDADRLLSQLRQPLPEGWQYLTLLLHSPGGDVREALLVAQLVKQALLRTSTFRLNKVGVGGPEDPHFLNTCVSACFLVWVAGTERAAYNTRAPGSGRHVGLGLHRPYLSSGSIDGKSPAEVARIHQDMTNTVRDYLRREQIPDSYVQKMLEHSSREVYWLADTGGNMGNFDLDGHAAWWDELLIARCGYDPAYDRDAMADTTARIIRAQENKVKLDLGSDVTYQRYITWKQAQNSCQYQMRLDAQASMRTGLQAKVR